MTINAGLLDAPGLFLTGEDNLRITSFGAIAGAEITMEGRLVTPEGRIVAFAERHVPNSDRTAKTSVHNIGDGVLTNVQLRAAIGTVLGGGVFAIVEVVRGITGALQPLGTLLQGYVTTNARLAWPGSPILPSTAGVGRLRSITGTDPAANVEISETVPAGVRWALQSFTVQLVTDATVANRVPRLVIDDGAATLAQVDSGGSTPASSTHRHSWTRGAGAFLNASSGALTSVAPTFMLAAGFRLRTSTLNLQAADNYGAPQYLVEEFME